MTSLDTGCNLHGELTSEQTGQAAKPKCVRLFKK